MLWALCCSRLAAGFKVSLKPDLTLDYSKWNVGAGNSIQYDSTGVIVNNFGISQGNQSLNINSTAQSVSAPIRVDLKNFEICNHYKTCAPGFFACIRNNKWYSRNY